MATHAENRTRLRVGWLERGVLNSALIGFDHPTISLIFTRRFQILRLIASRCRNHAFLESRKAFIQPAADCLSFRSGVITHRACSSRDSNVLFGCSLQDSPLCNGLYFTQAIKPSSHSDLICSKSLNSELSSSLHERALQVPG